MRILLDECVPRKLANHLRPNHSVTTVPKLKLGGTKDRQLLTFIQLRLDAFVTVDRNLRFQKNLNKLKFAVVVLHGKSNRYRDLLPLVPELLQVLNHARPGQIIHVPAESDIADSPRKRRR